MANEENIKLVTLRLNSYYGDGITPQTKATMTEAKHNFISLLEQGFYSKKEALDFVEQHVDADALFCIKRLMDHPGYRTDAFSDKMGIRRFYLFEEVRMGVKPMVRFQVVTYMPNQKIETQDIDAVYLFIEPGKTKLTNWKRPLNEQVLVYSEEIKGVAATYYGESDLIFWLNYHGRELLTEEQFIVTSSCVEDYIGINKRLPKQRPTNKHYCVYISDKFVKIALIFSGTLPHNFIKVCK